MNYVPTILAKLRPNRPSKLMIWLSSQVWLYLYTMTFSIADDLAAASLTDTPAIVTMSHSRLCQVRYLTFVIAPYGQ